MTPTDTMATIAAPLSLDALAGILISGIESGINYWCTGVSGNYGGKLREQFEEENRELIDKINFGVLPLLPFMPNCSLVFTEDEEGSPEHNLTKEKVQKGLDVLATKYPHHIGNILEDNADAETGDVLIQCALFGEIVYG